MTTSDVAVIASLLGIVLGTLGATLGVMSYLRDRPKVIVTLQWDMTVVNRPDLEGSKRWGLVTLSNVGRRPICVSHAVLVFPKAAPNRFLLLEEGLGYRKLNEADPPVPVMVTQEGLERYAPYWRGVYARVSDSSNRTWRSEKIPKDRIPSWAVAHPEVTSSQ